MKGAAPRTTMLDRGLAKCGLPTSARVLSSAGIAVGFASGASAKGKGLLKVQTGRALGITILLMSILHILALGVPTAKRVVWLVRRYPDCHSSEERWRTKALNYPQIVAAVRKEVPERACLTVRHADLGLGLELAFYAFPRRIFFEKAPETGVDRLVLRAVGSDAWVVRVE